MPQRGHVQVGLKTGHLAAKRVALNDNIHQPQQRLRAAHLARHENGAGAGAPQRMFRRKGLQRLHQVKIHRQFADGGRLAAGNDQSVQPVQVSGQAHLAHFGAQALQHHLVFVKRALQREYANPHAFYQPRPASSSFSGMLVTLRPTIASPRLRLTSASTAGSL